MKHAAHPDVIDALAAAINARDLGALDAVFTDDIVMEWPQSGERIRGAHSRRAHRPRDGVLDQAVPRARLARAVGRTHVMRQRRVVARAGGQRTGALTGCHSERSAEGAESRNRARPGSEFPLSG